MKSLLVTAGLTFGGMLLGAACALWLLACFGLRFEPFSSFPQTAGLLAALLGFAVVHATRRQPEVRAVAATLPPGRFSIGRDALAVLLGVVAVVAFFSPSLPPVKSFIAEGERGGGRESADAGAWTVGGAVRPDGPRDLRIGRAGVTMDPAAGKTGPSAGGTTALHPAPGVEDASFRMDGSRFRWPLPLETVPVQSQPQDAPRLAKDPVLRLVNTSPRFVLDKVLPAARAVRRDDDHLFAVFLSGMELRPARGRLPCPAIPSLSEKGESAKFTARGRDDAPVAFVIGSSQPGDDLIATLKEYLWVSFDAQGLPALNCGGGADEPFDVLGESEVREIPREVLEDYAARWQAVRRQSARRAWLPVGMVFGESRRRFPDCVLARDIPRTSPGHLWCALAVAACLFLALK